MERVIGIRREDKNEWERRTPLVPEDVRWLRERFGIQTVLQPSTIRIYPDEEYARSGSVIDEALDRASVIFAIKEIPEHALEKGKTYVFFSHTTKGQTHNLPMLRRMTELGCNLIDYERIVDEQNQRLMFFGPFAGLAGMIETLHAFGEKLKKRGTDTPFARIRHAYEYPSLEDARIEIGKIGEEIADSGFPAELAPLVAGFAGYGHVSRGAQEIFDLLPHKTISADAMREMFENFASDRWTLYKVVFREDDLVRAREGTFDLEEYYRHPEKYESKFTEYLPYLTILINGIFWSERYPRLVTRDYLRSSAMLGSCLNLQVIGDISCDIRGSIEVNCRSTTPAAPCYTYFPDSDLCSEGVGRLGITVMAVDNLPCEFARESSIAFSKKLRDFVCEITAADFTQKWDQLRLSRPIQKAVILHRGRFTPDYEYMKKFLM